MGYFGQARTYRMRAIFSQDTFGNCVFGKNTEADMFTFRYGAPVPRTKGKWAVTPGMCCRRHGAWAKRIIYFTWRGRQMARRYTPYDGSPKAYLVPWSQKLADAMAIWKNLSVEAKARLYADALRTRQAKQSGHYFVKLYIKDDPRWMDYV
jgi:hypothetical protein